MTRQTKRLLLGLGLTAFMGFALFCAGCAWYFYPFYEEISAPPSGYEVRPSKRAEVIDCTCEWCRTAPLPASANVTSVTKAGSIFTRGLRVTFTAPAEEIEDWLRQSPGVRKAAMSASSAGYRHYLIDAGGGASFAEVTVYDKEQKVVMHAYWS